MSRQLFDFLTESIIFDENQIRNNYCRVERKRLTNELIAYRNHVQTHLDEIFEDATESKLSIVIDCHENRRPSPELLKQLALYIDQVIIDDPVFSVSEPPSGHTKAMARLLETGCGYSSCDIAEAAEYMKSLTPAVVGGFVKFLPIGRCLKGSDEVPLLFSENHYASLLPLDIMKWFRSKAKVCKLGDDLVIIHDDPLEPCCNIAILFEGLPETVEMSSFVQTEILSVDGNKFSVVMRKGDPPENFDDWILDQANLAARNIFDRISTQTLYAWGLSSTFLTTSPFVCELLNLHIRPEGDLESEIVNHTLKLDLPLLNTASLEDIMQARTEEEAFDNFRTHLEKSLRELRTADQASLKPRLQNLSYELAEVQIRDIERRIANFKRSPLLVDGVLAVGTLVATIQLGSLGLLGILGLGAKGYSTYRRHVTEIKQHPCYFLWRIGR
jgi:hypothetical protein